MRRATVPLLCGVGLALAALLGCGGTSGAGARAPAGADLSLFEMATVHVDQQPFAVWLAETALQRRLGLSEATADQLAPLGDGTPRGMLFVFGTEQVVSFWMRDTYVALDLAYVREDGTIAEIHAMTPLDERSVPSGEAVRYALEVPAGTLAALGIGVGSTLALPL